jgi:hypothetical protein
LRLVRSFQNILSPFTPPAMKKFLLIPALFLLSLTACDKEAETPPATTKDKLTSGIWKLLQQGEDVNKNDLLEAGELLPLENCEKDDTYQFKPDQTLVISNNALKCDDSDPATETLNWALTANDSELILSQPGFPLSFNFRILELTGTTLRLSFTDGTDKAIIVYGR